MSAIKFTTDCGLSYTGYFDSFKTEVCLDIIEALQREKLANDVHKVTMNARLNIRTQLFCTYYVLLQYCKIRAKKLESRDYHFLFFGNREARDYRDH